MLDLLFPVLGDGIPTDHGYPLYAALSGVVPELHDPAFPTRVSAVGGEPAGAGRLRLTDRSVLRVRVPTDRIGAVLPLAGRRLEVGPDAVRFGVPRVAALVPAPTVFARVVTLKCSGHADQEKCRRYTEVEPFLEAVRRRLAALGVAGEATVPVVRGGKWAGTPVRRVVRVKGKAVVGFAVVVGGLSEADSVKLQEAGLGGRGRMGCGFFVPVRQGGES